VKLVIEPERWRKFIKIATVYKQSPLIPTPVAECSDKGVRIMDMSEGSIAIASMFRKDYFLEYSVGEPEILPITTSLMDCLSFGFKSDKISVETSKEEIKISNGRDEYTTRKLDKGAEPFTLPVEFGEFGIVTKVTDKTGELLGRVLLDGKELEVAKAELYELTSDGRSLFIVLKTEEGTFKRRLDVKQAVALNPMDVYLDGEYYQHITENLEGEVWLSVTPNVVNFSRKAKDHVYTYIVTTSTPPGSE